MNDIGAQGDMIPLGPVHRLENIDGNPNRIQTACKKFCWVSQWTELLDPNRKSKHSVTCQECLMAMVDNPIIVKVP